MKPNLTFLAALLWMQGESDARVPELAKEYQQHLTNFLTFPTSPFDTTTIIPIPILNVRYASPFANFPLFSKY